MAEKLFPKEPDYVACEVCLSEIPASVAASQEADGYAQHYCGIDCYNRWKNQPEEVDAGN